jgi:nucleoside 2-deoxyribosyltransferase
MTIGHWRSGAVRQRPARRYATEPPYPLITEVFLAGPDVFLSDAADWFARKKAICAGFRLTGVARLDDLPDQPAGWSALPERSRIALRNEAQMRSCAAIIANLPPLSWPLSRRRHHP